jgi:hypothetical protein
MEEKEDLYLSRELQMEMMKSIWASWAAAKRKDKHDIYTVD